MIDSECLPFFDAILSTFLAECMLDVPTAGNEFACWGSSRMKRKRFNVPFLFSRYLVVFGIYFSLYLLVNVVLIDKAVTFPLVVTAWSLSTSSAQRCHEFPENMGVTSLHLCSWKSVKVDADEASFESLLLLIAGTKNGRIFCSPKIEKEDHWTQINNSDSVTTNKYPIYSLTSSPTHLFCGGGNRYISVWSRTSKQESDDAVFDYQQELGPHTGWVKDLVFDEQHQLLHSIGCNCIETWDCSTMPFHHSSKRSIENSPSMGMTLSSDLLCLCLAQKHSESFLVSGGVDGRIHLWNSDPSGTNGEPLWSIAAHNGRVNKIVYSTAINAILSVGNDGKLSACRLQDLTRSGLTLELLLSVTTRESLDQLRATALTLVDNDVDQKQCTVALGSSDGQVCLVTIQESSEGTLNHELQSVAIKIDDGPLIYALACIIITPGSDCLLWIGHATGLVSRNIVNS